ncbi:hypothetical protein [Phyllobacterium zundukense]|uniref:Uncharacterized protein n=1 Tax=Phyllobacterium zundukense TaxID=1867719 RepID=A0ACD4CWB4_9HYPH|nr:hypothetical protein [Phyllobacterium zundukense]UXN57782.1 hypothetical protein N8E88_02970 [Phyllobacterium zundukense]
MGTLATASQAIKIAKDLRDIARDVNSASYKAKMDELYGGLADIKIALSDAREELHEKDTLIKKLQGEIVALKSGETCPLCRSGRFKVTAVRDHPTFGVFGIRNIRLRARIQTADIRNGVKWFRLRKEVMKYSV